MAVKESAECGVRSAYLKKWLVGLSVLLLAVMVSGCAVVRTEAVSKIALLTSFEGRYREIGYNALYAAQLALKEQGSTTITLLPIDDGGSVEKAVQRARALVLDSTIKMVLVQGIYTTDSAVLQALDPLPVLIVGHWGAEPQPPRVMMLASADLAARLTVSPAVNRDVLQAAEYADQQRQGEIFWGGEVFALEQFAELTTPPNNLTVLFSGNFPDAVSDFNQRYAAMNAFTPDPNLFATLTYDAMQTAILAVANQIPLTDVVYEGINGTIAFDERGYWRDAFITMFYYAETGSLTIVPME